MGLWNLSSSPFHERLTAQEGKAIIRKGYRRGIRLFDTAYSYGDAESILSAALHELGASDAVVISKVMPVPSLRKKAETTLRRLRTESVGILLLHWPAEDESLFRSLRELEKLKDEGKAAETGVSNFPLPLLSSVIRDFPITFHERPLSLLWIRGWKEEKSLGLKTLAYAPLGMGVLSGHYAGGDARSSIAGSSSQYLPSLLEELGGDPALALSWVYGEKPYGVVSGFSRPEDLCILDRIKEIPEDKRARLSMLAEKIDGEAESDNIFAHKWKV